MYRKAPFALLLVALAAACLVAMPSVAGAADKTKWLCKPGLKNNPCVSDLTATVLHSDGTTTTEHHQNAKKPLVDCFYVYPTVSDQQTTNANLKIDPVERAVADYQAARFSQVCHVWAPMYRQLTLKAIGKKVPAAARLKAYRSARAGWREYLAKHNHGRGFILIGHSQGSFVLRQLIAEEIDKKPAVRHRMVSALLLGGNVLVRKGKGIGGDFSNVPACREPRQVSCVVAYSMFGDTPPANALFGRVPKGTAGGSKLRVLCTNPAALAGGSGTLQAYASSLPFPGTLGLGIRIFLGETPDVPTHWWRPPGRYTASCSTAGGASFLKVDSLDGARAPTPTPDPTWGYHLGDINLALGNLTTLAATQARSYRDMLVAEKRPRR
ncbi:MAG: hypothetical protein QOC77_3552 [Thermoleophilaceae bacterium]|jgi:hypothetical protein|nr:hypothetical protein [Thermoleophilaceae bacterium]